MSSDQLPADFAPFHVVRADLPRPQGAGRFYKLSLALLTLDYLRRQFPEGEWIVMNDGGVIDDGQLDRAESATLDDVDYLKRATLAHLYLKPAFRIVKKAA